MKLTLIHITIFSYILNILYGILIVQNGLDLFHYNKDLEEYIYYKNTLWISYAVLIYGIYIYLLGCLGCLELLNEHTDYQRKIQFVKLNIYQLFISIFIILYFTTFIIIYQDIEKRKMKENINKIFKLEIINKIHDIQNNFQCCGDLMYTKYWKNLPISCCDDIINNNFNCNIHKSNCVTKILEISHNKINNLILSSIFFILFQLCCILINVKFYFEAII